MPVKAEIVQKLPLLPLLSILVQNHAIIIHSTNPNQLILLERSFLALPFGIQAAAQAATPAQFTLRPTLVMAQSFNLLIHTSTTLRHATQPPMTKYTTVGKKRLVCRLGTYLYNINTDAHFSTQQGVPIHRFVPTTIHEDLMLWVGLVCWQHKALNICVPEDIRHQKYAPPLGSFPKSRMHWFDIQHCFGLNFFVRDGIHGSYAPVKTLKTHEWILALIQVRKLLQGHSLVSRAIHRVLSLRVGEPAGGFKIEPKHFSCQFLSEAKCTAAMWPLRRFPTKNSKISPWKWVSLPSSPKFWKPKFPSLFELQSTMMAARYAQVSTCGNWKFGLPARLIFYRHIFTYVFKHAQNMRLLKSVKLKSQVRKEIKLKEDKGIDWI
ncbi:hypothetical protein K439DRAFT_1613536 [Ramaria rubella]|nr:hypothetical protein K439DRAFT_1613536 [Ramaria rubella]